jgi:hypothetical protein
MAQITPSNLQITPSNPGHTEQPSRTIEIPPIAIEAVEIGGEIVLLGLSVLILSARQKIYKALEAIKKKVETGLPLDQNQPLKTHLSELLAGLRTVTNTNYACLGIMHNGQFTEWGYSFSRVTWEIETKSPGLLPITPELKDVCINNWIQPEPRWFHYENFLCYPIKINQNIQVGIIILGCYGTEKCVIEITEKEQQLAQEISNCVIEIFLNENKRPK